jgi:hypothetical protein
MVGYRSAAMTGRLVYRSPFTNSLSCLTLNSKFQLRRLVRPLALFQLKNKTYRKSKSSILKSSIVVRARVLSNFARKFQVKSAPHTGKRTIGANL